jgi:HSP20 family molecular chaperone IbpA
MAIGRPSRPCVRERGRGTVTTMNLLARWFRRSPAAPSWIEAAARVDNAALAYPPYNIEKTGEDAYRLTMAVAGFSPDEVDVTVHENSLLVTGKAKKEDENGACEAT